MLGYTSAGVGRVLFFCMALSIDRVVGVRRGRSPWMSVFNRIFMLADLLRQNYDDWVIYLDADAFPIDMGFDLPAYLCRNSKWSLIATEGGANRGDQDGYLSEHRRYLRRALVTMA